jgi:hypothetical protein
VFEGLQEEAESSTLIYYPGIHLEELIKTIKEPQDSWSLANCGSPEYKKLWSLHFTLAKITSL